MVSELINANPIVYEKKERRARSAPTVADEYAVESIDQQEVFDILSVQFFFFFVFLIRHFDLLLLFILVWFMYF
jgi:hypothetical protein